MGNSKIAFGKHVSSQRRSGFSLLELLVVLSIISVLAALLLPVLFTVQGKAREIRCNSNLRQIGLSIAMYAQDYDGLYPFAVDPMDKFAPQSWDSYPQFKAQIPTMPLIQDSLKTYSAPALFRCPSDTGFNIGDFNGLPLDAQPSSFEKFGTSYYYRTEIALRRASEMTFDTPSQINVLFDGAGYWHGTLIPLAQRYNVLFADGHIKNLTRPQIDAVWSMPLQQPSP